MRSRVRIPLRGVKDSDIAQLDRAHAAPLVLRDWWGFLFKERDYVRKLPSGDLGKIFMVESIECI